MRSIPLAMIWELVYCGRWVLLLGAVGANILPLLILAALRNQGALDLEEPAMIGMCLALAQINNFSFGAAVMSAQRKYSRFYGFPMTTASLVTWHMLPGMALMFMQSLSSTLLVNALFGLHWPLWGPALFAAVSLVVIQAALWQTEQVGWVLLFMTTSAAALGLWHKGRHGPVFREATHLWNDVTPLEFITMLLAVGLSYWAAVVGFARKRRGDELRSFGIFAWIGRFFDPAPEFGPPFRSPLAAQEWIEWRTKGGFLPACTVFGIVMVLFGWACDSRDPKQLVEGFIIGGGFLTLVGIIVGMIMGNMGKTDAEFEIGHFRATRPLTSTDMARTILKTAAKSVLIAWLIWGAAFLLVLGVMVTCGLRSLIVIPSGIGWWYLPATLLGAWMTVSVVTSIFLSGRAGHFSVVFLVLFTLSIIGSQCSFYLLSKENQTLLWQGVLATAGVVFTIGTAWMFVAARRRSMIGRPTVWAAASAWIALSLLVVLERIMHPGNPWPVHILAVGLLALAALPLASAPLALAWNRTR